MNIGLIIATKNEIQALSQALKTISVITDPLISTFRIKNNCFYTIESGVGEIRAAAATQELIMRSNPDLIINFGVCGGLNPDISSGEVVAVKSIVHYNRDISAVDNTEAERYEQYKSIYIPTNAELIDRVIDFMPNVRQVICASGDEFVADPKRKLELLKKYKAEICDMEAAGIQLTADKAGVPTLIIKAVSDDSKGGENEYWNTVETAAANCAKLLLQIIQGGI